MHHSKRDRLARRKKVNRPDTVPNQESLAGDHGRFGAQPKRTDVEQQSLNCPACAAVSVQTAVWGDLLLPHSSGKSGIAPKLVIIFCGFSISPRQLGFFYLHARSDNLAIVIHLSGTFQRDLVLRHLAALPHGRSLRVRIGLCFRPRVRDLLDHRGMNAADGIDHLRSPSLLKCEIGGCQPNFSALHSPRHP